MACSGRRPARGGGLLGAAYAPRPGHAPAGSAPPDRHVTRPSVPLSCLVPSGALPPFAGPGLVRPSGLVCAGGGVLRRVFPCRAGAWLAGAAWSGLVRPAWSGLVCAGGGVLRRVLPCRAGAWAGPCRPARSARPPGLVRPAGPLASPVRPPGPATRPGLCRGGAPRRACPARTGARPAGRPRPPPSPGIARPRRPALPVPRRPAAPVRRRPALPVRPGSRPRPPGCAPSPPVFRWPREGSWPGAWAVAGGRAARARRRAG